MGTSDCSQNLPPWQEFGVGPLGSQRREAEDAATTPTTGERFPSGHQRDAADETDDIEAYMEQWLRRVRGQTDEPGSMAPETSTVASPTFAGPSATGPTATGPTATGKSTVSHPSPLAGLPSAATLDSSRSGKLERPAELKALREVANVSARSAINGSLRKQFLREFQAKATVSFVALAMAGVLFLLSPQLNSVLSLGAAACTLVSAFWGLRIVGDWLRMRGRRSRV